MRLLVTGFPPFANRPVNPSQTLVQDVLAGKVQFPAGITVKAALLPVDYDAIESRFVELVEEFRPDVWLAFGVGRNTIPIQLETVGHNCDDASIPDNAGVLRQNQLIRDDGPELYRVKHSVDSLLSSLQSENVESGISDDAGRYLCNHLFYYALNYLERAGIDCRFQFIHLAPAETGIPGELYSLGLQIMAKWFQNDGNATEAECAG
ncbi:hypothetical protein SH668x_001088 [Planctomicrobium sp. SH668]|uniref:pyroglutamyl-peptidase I family protein n=1 Tax=Planctomicrobium sp. SH668 TaxID=3448126 RepID=UPI003F5C65D4